MIKARIVKPVMALALVAAVLAGCGGSSGADTTIRPGVSAIKTFGDSLADVGTIYGIRYTVQGNDILPEIIGQQYGLGKNCNYYTGTGDVPNDILSFAPNTQLGCTNYAIGGGRINAPGKGYAVNDPRGVKVQLAEATKTGNFNSGDLLIINGGGNDAADLTGAYLKSQTDGGAAYLGLLRMKLSNDQVAAAVALQQAGLAMAGGTYITALADEFYDTIKTSALDKGAQRVVLINMPAITNTPRFQTVLDGVAAAYGGGTLGATKRADTEALINSWVVAFNTRLAARSANESRIALVDLYSNFNDQIANPDQYKLTNVKTPACPAKPLPGKDGLPDYDFPTCTDTALQNLTPSGASSDWYKSYLFSDGFHPTPYGHKLASQLLSRSLAQKGWL